ncbi:MAG: cytochrome-c oxidase, cbb3-type subunit III [Hydrogenophilales bacterium]|nr:cytochrome-c oxidase, cbb3-type subunit III [Hydrogenophilales bacterium]
MIEGYAVPDFVSNFWHLYIAGITIVSILGIMWFLKSQTTSKLAPGEKAEVIDHTWDGDLQELNNPLPRWWLYLFWFLIVFGILYLVLYPGLGKYEGVWKWSSASSYQSEKDRLDAAFNEQFAPFKGMDLHTVAADPKAMEMGQRLFLTYCSQCHGSGGLGGKNFPNLTDSHWLFGGDADSIKQSIDQGRLAEMPANMLGDEQSAREVANYVLSLGGKPHDAALAAAGQPKFAACAGCHGEDGKGMPAASFPNLTDDAWQYGGSEAAIVESIVKGRKGGMPAIEALGSGDARAAKVHLLAAYVASLGGASAPSAAPAAMEAAGPAVAKVFFEVGTASAPADLAATLQAIVDHATANADSKVAISGFHDPSGNQVANEELAKNRAKAVREALKAAGIAEERIEMRKPADTQGAGSAEEARRVEVSII